VEEERGVMITCFLWLGGEGGRSDDNRWIEVGGGRSDANRWLGGGARSDDNI
jgi:hypothetical protein